jgi:putative transposase
MSKFDPKIHHRRSIRLKEYDYAQAGGYYITIVAWQRKCLFGEVVNGDVRLNKYGKIIETCWQEIANHFQNVELGAFIVMPNHFHGIIYIVERRGAVPAPRNRQTENNFEELQKIKNRELNAPENSNLSTNRGGETPPLRRPTLGQMMAYFKYQSTKRMNVLSNTGVITKLWQRNYYEHIIRDEQDLQNKTEYIQANPLLWEQDDENPDYKSGRYNEPS